MKNKNGFTLIELLAVIAILSIILIIATTSIIKSINSSKEETFITSYNNIVDEVSKKIIEKRTSNVQVECADDTTNIDNSYDSLESCSQLYDISETDYDLYVLKFEGGYFVILEGQGKFENINLEKKYEELISKKIYPLRHDFGFDKKIEENFSKNSLLTVVSLYGEIIDITKDINLQNSN